MAFEDPCLAIQGASCKYFFDFESQAKRYAHKGAFKALTLFKDKATFSLS